MTSPSQFKRMRTGHDSFKITKFEESDSENGDIIDYNVADNDELNNAASRKKRGLKILSVKVQELVS
jgi:hypothetical protein